MKTMRKIFALALAVMMVMSLATTAFAADDANEEPTGITYNITVPATDTHTYEVYQIFTGDLYEGVLSNVVWGKNGTGTTGNPVDEDTLNALEALKDSTSDSAKLAEIIQYVNINSEKFATVQGGQSIPVAPGYYLLKDVENIAEDDAYTTYIVMVVEDVSVNRKAAKPSVDKQVDDDSVWGETADQELNESFQFKLIATLEEDSDYAEYETYKLVFHDTMSAGITFESIESVTVNGTPIDGYDCTATAGQAGGSWTLTINDLTDHVENLSAGCVVEVIYNAHLNENAKIGEPGNPNEVQLEYSNNPNWDLDGDGKPDNPDEPDEPTGKTPEDIVWVFTYELDVTKVDGNNAEKKLKDAEFVLLNKDQTEVAIVVDGKLTDWVAVPADGKTWPANSVLKSGEDGLFVIQGLDDGTYYLQETKAPDGYNLLTAPVKVVVTATHSETEDGTKAKIDALTISVDGGAAVDGDPTSGIVTMDVENKAGATLPETGGMGTTIFYALGGIMVLAAVVLLVTKRRMNIAG